MVRWWTALESTGQTDRLNVEFVPIEQAGGRITAEPFFARQSVPHYHAAAMDGYALRSAATQGVNDRNPVTLESVSAIDGPALMALAVFVGNTRLIDNIMLYPE